MRHFILPLCICGCCRTQRKLTVVCVYLLLFNLYVAILFSSVELVRGSPGGATQHPCRENKQATGQNGGSFDFQIMVPKCKEIPKIIWLHHLLFASALPGIEMFLCIYIRFDPKDTSVPLGSPITSQNQVNHAVQETKIDHCPEFWRRARGMRERLSSSCFIFLKI